MRRASSVLAAARQIEVISGVNKDDLNVLPTKPSPQVGHSWTDALEG